MSYYIVLLTLIYSSVAAAIYNGTPAFLQRQELVYAVDISQDTVEVENCSGTVISDYTILTAAHCTAHLDLDAGQTVKLLGREYEVEDIFVPLSYYEASNKYYDALYSVEEDKKLYNKVLLSSHRNVALHDLSLITLRKEVSSHVNRVQLIYKPTQSKTLVDIMGMGLMYMNKNTFEFYGVPDQLYFHSLYMRVLDNGVYIIEGKDLFDYMTTPGDSGGAMLLPFTNMQIGVLRGSSAEPDRAASIFTPIYLHEEFIKKFLK